MNIEEIQNRFERGYTMAIYGTRENIHEQMNNDIEKLLEAINFTGSSLELPTAGEINIKASERAKQIAPTNATPLVSHRISFRMGANFVKEHISKNKQAIT